MLQTSPGGYFGGCLYALLLSWVESETWADVQGIGGAQFLLLLTAYQQNWPSASHEVFWRMIEEALPKHAPTASFRVFAAAFGAYYEASRRFLPTPPPPAQEPIFARRIVRRNKPRRASQQRCLCRMKRALRKKQFPAPPYRDL